MTIAVIVVAVNDCRKGDRRNVCCGVASQLWPSRWMTIAVTSQMTVAVMRSNVAVMIVAVDECCSDYCHNVSYVGRGKVEYQVMGGAANLLIAF